MPPTPGSSPSTGILWGGGYTWTGWGYTGLAITTSAAKYKNAGTMEFLVDGDSHLHFIKINTRIQVSERMRE